MANVKVTELTALAAADSASTDVLPVVDVSADATKKLAISDLHRSVPDGTLSAPGIAFQSDLNSGLYRSGTDAIALVTNGAARILIDATGNVTIPNDLTVQGATTFITGQTVLIEDKNIELGVVTTPTDVTADGGGITLKGATDKTIKWIDSTNAWTFNNMISVQTSVSSTAYAELKTDGSALGLSANLTAGSSASDSVALNFKTSNSGTETTKMRIDPDGKVGIGFSAEQAPLEVQGQNAFASAASTLATAATKAAFRVKGSNNSSDSLWMGTVTTNAEPYIQGANGIGSASKDLLLNPFGGDVGIGTTSPEMDLHVKDGNNGEVKIGGSSSATGLEITYSNSGTTTTNIHQVYRSTSGSALLNIDTGTFTVSTGTSGNESMRIDSSGNVGIGLDTSLAGLCVNNTIRSQNTSSNISYIGFTGHTGNTTVGTMYSYMGGDGRSTGYLNFSTNDDERMRIDSDGNIGIGNVNPSSYGSPKTLISGADPTLTLMGTGSTNGSSFAGIKFRVAGSSTGDYTKAGIFSRREGGYNDLSLIFALNTTADASSVSIADEKMRIDSSGRLLVSGQASLTSTSLSHPIQIAADSSAQNIVCFGRASDDISAINFYEADKATNLGEIQYRRDHVNFRHRVGYIAFATGGTTEKMRIDSDGRLLVGTSSSQTIGNSQAQLEVSTDSSAGYALSLSRSVADIYGPQINLRSTRGTAASPVIVSDDDQLGSIAFYGYDGTDSNHQHASIAAFVDGTPGSNDCPGRIVFSTTADGASSPTERMRINSSGTVLFGGESTADNDHAHIDSSGTLTVRRTSGTSDAIIVREGATMSWLVEADGRCQSFNVGSLAFLAYDTESTGATDSAYAAMGSVSGEARITGGHSGTGDTPLVFRTSDGGTEAEKMRLLPEGGLTFNGDTAQANALDDYEEGTWTPVIKSGSNTISVSGGTQAYRYIKIGNKVTVFYTANNVTTSGTTGGNFAIEGLPFTSKNADIRSVGTTVVWYNSGLKGDNWPSFGHLNPNSSTMNVYYKSSASGAYDHVLVNTVGAASYLFWQITYETA